MTSTNGDQGAQDQLLSHRWNVFFAAVAVLLVPAFLLAWQWSAARFPALDIMALLLVLPVVYWLLYFTKRRRVWARKILVVIAVAAGTLAGLAVLGFLILVMMMS